MIQRDGKNTNRELPRSPGTKIVRAAEEEAWRNGLRFLAEAERVYAAEAAKGFAAGKAAGEKEASTLVLGTAVRVDRYIASLEPQLATLALEVVRRILSDFDGADLVANAARTALAEFREEKAVILKIHPSAQSRVGAMIAELQQSPDWRAVTISVETDAELSEWACILTTDFAMVDATVETQLEAIAEAIETWAAGNTR